MWLELLFYLSLLFAGGDKTPVLWRLSFFGVWARRWVGDEDDPSDEETVCSAIASFHTSPPPCLFLGSTEEKTEDLDQNSLKIKKKVEKMAKLSLFLIYRNSPRHLLNSWSEFQSCACIEFYARIFLVKTARSSTRIKPFNPIPTGLGHMTLIYGLIPPMAGRNRVKWHIDATRW